MEIRIFHYNKRQDEGIYWVIMAGGELHFVKSWMAETWISSVQSEDLKIRHPDYLGGNTSLPRFHLLTRGKLKVERDLARITL